MTMITRILTVKLQAGDADVPIIISTPTQGDRCWECSFSIGWPEGESISVVRGYDGVQALYLTMQRIAVELYGSAYHASCALRWGKLGEGYGFPMPKGGYEDLVGEDRIAQVPD
ncbi:DUF6968 family protein [Devosia sp.]|uniref:DUF6968 family protein n=1 Tax=Devosia sp. TaxID=1871048 RepID=UPI002FC89F9D